MGWRSFGVVSLELRAEQGDGGQQENQPTACLWGLLFCRGRRTHKGVDVVCTDGSAVYAPFAGKIDKQAKPYGNGNAIDNGIQLSGAGSQAEGCALATPDCKMLPAVYFILS